MALVTVYQAANEFMALTVRDMLLEGQVSSMIKSNVIAGYNTHVGSWGEVLVEFFEAKRMRGVFVSAGPARQRGRGGHHRLRDRIVEQDGVEQVECTREHQPLHLTRLAFDPWLLPFVAGPEGARQFEVLIVAVDVVERGGYIEDRRAREQVLEVEGGEDAALDLDVPLVQVAVEHDRWYLAAERSDALVGGLGRFAQEVPKTV